MILKKVLVIAEKETLLVRVLIKKTQDAGIEAIYAPLDVDLIDMMWEDISAVVFYMDLGVSLPKDVYAYLRDKLEEEDKHMILIGDKTDIQDVTKMISGNLIYKSLMRPLDNDVYIETLEEMLDKLKKGELHKSILVVDDDPTYLGLVREWLRDSYRVAMVPSGLQAIKWLAKNKADLILLDYEMPVTSGPQVLEMLRSEEETKNIPVIFLTGKSDRESVLSVVELKPEGYLLKNIEKKELLLKIKAFFDEYSRR
ncbi:MAG: response regulator [Lachnospiraceae bacterium]|nr:response regulator [Lachnospiraceae bacterium]